MRNKSQIGGLINNTGYLDGAPTAGNPYNIIPGGNITMQGVSMPLWATPIKNGKAKKPVMLQPGNNYQFNADFVHERPVANPVPRIYINPYMNTNEQMQPELGVNAGYNFRNGNQLGLDYSIGDDLPSLTAKIHFQQGGNIYQQGGFSKKDVLNFLFEDDKKEDVPTAPTEEEVKPDVEKPQEDTPDSDYELAMQIANQTGDETPESQFPEGNPYGVPTGPPSGNPYSQPQNTKASPNALATLQEFQPQGFTNLGIFPSKQHMLQNPHSDHNTGRALDLGVSNSVKGDEAVSKLQTEAKDKNIKYIIWNRKIWNPSTNTWKPYTGRDPHTTHIHISFNQ